MLHAAKGRFDDLDDRRPEDELELVWGRLDDLGGRLKSALTHLMNAARIAAPGTALAAEVEIALASAERRRGEFNKALARLLAMGHSELPERIRAEYLDELGAVRLARGEAPEAITTLESGLALDEATATSYAGGRSRLLLAEAYMHVGSRREARGLIDAAFDAYRASGMDAGLSDANALLGQWYEDADDHIAASSCYQESYELDRSTNDVAGQVRSKRRLARTYRKRGQNQRARELVVEAWDIFKNLPEDDVEAASLLQEEGFQELEGPSPDYVRAIELFNKALTIATDDGDERTMAVAKRHLARAYREDDDLPRALDLLNEARVTLNERGDLRELDDLLDDLGEVYLELDENEVAEACLLESLALDERLSSVGSKGRTLLLLGEVAVREANFGLAKRRFCEALDLCDAVGNEIGLADALLRLAKLDLHLGAWDAARAGINRALQIHTRFHRPLGRARARCLLGAFYRLQGNLDRAREVMAEAQADIVGIDDPTERASIELELGRLELASGRYSAAIENAAAAQQVFEKSRNPVDVVSCQRLIATALALEGEHSEALDLLRRALKELEERKDVPELGELYDDLATVQLLAGHIRDARHSVSQSLEFARETGRTTHKGRALLLLAKIESLSMNPRKAHAHITDALDVFDSHEDERGRAMAEIELGDWWADARNHGFDEREAQIRYVHGVSAYKEARRRVRIQGDRRTSARCNRKLATIYVTRHELERAEEALQDALAELDGVDDPREIVAIALQLGRLAAEKHDHDEAIRHYHRALEGFSRARHVHGRMEAYRLLAQSHHARGETREALESLSEMPTERTAVWGVALSRLDSPVVTAARSAFHEGRYTEAVRLGFDRLGELFKARSRTLPNPPPQASNISDHIRAWLRSGGQGLPQFAKASSLGAFERFAIDAFDLIRNPAVHESTELSPNEAFASLSVAHWIASRVCGDADQMSSESSVEQRAAH